MSIMQTTQEKSIQEPRNVVVWITFHAFALFSAVSRWWRFKRVCAWHSKLMRMGGNPLAKQVTHGICADCAAKQFDEIMKHQQTK
jgi:hypothetical protein